MRVKLCEQDDFVGLVFFHTSILLGPRYNLICFLCSHKISTIFTTYFRNADCKKENQWWDYSLFFDKTITIHKTKQQPLNRKLNSPNNGIRAYLIRDIWE